MMGSPQSKDPQKADPLADALERLERSVAKREKSRKASLAESGSNVREKGVAKVTERNVAALEVNNEVGLSGMRLVPMSRIKKIFQRRTGHGPEQHLM